MVRIAAFKNETNSRAMQHKTKTRYICQGKAQAYFWVVKTDFEFLIKDNQSSRG